MQEVDKLKGGRQLQRPMTLLIEPDQESHLIIDDDSAEDIKVEIVKEVENDGFLNIMERNMQSPMPMSARNTVGKKDNEMFEFDDDDSSKVEAIARDDRLDMSERLADNNSPGGNSLLIDVDHGSINSGH